MNQDNLKLNPERISKFYDPSDVEFSMHLLEKHLSCLKFTDDVDKFNYVCSVLPLSACKLVKDFILDPPDKHPVKVLKMALIERTFSLEAEKTNNLSLEEINNHKPSMILQRLREALDYNMDEDKNTNDEGKNADEEDKNKPKMTLQQMGKGLDINTMDEALLSIFRKFLPISFQPTLDNLLNNLSLNKIAMFADVYMQSLYVTPISLETTDNKNVKNTVIDEQTELSQKVDRLRSSLVSILGMVKAHFEEKNNLNETVDESNIELNETESLVPGLIKILGKRCGINI